MTKNNIKNKQLIVFFALSYIISWTLWILSDVFNSSLLEVLGRFGPLVSAVIITGTTNGLLGIKQILKKFCICKVGLSWYIFCFLSTAVIAMTAIGINQIITEVKPIYNNPQEWYLIFPVFFYVLFFSVLGEETGWRGFALPRLQKKFSALTSSLIIGILWGFWHLPLFFIEGEFHQTIPIWLFLIQDVALSIIMTWLYNNTKGSLLISHLFHAASNVTIGLLPILPLDTNGDLGALYITIAILIVFTVLIIVTNGPEHLSRKVKRVTRQDEIKNEE